MFYGYGRGRGFGCGGGFGFRGMTPPYPYIGRGRGGLPRCGYYPGGAVAGYPAATTAGEEELAYLKDRVATLKAQLEEMKSHLKNRENI